MWNVRTVDVYLTCLSGIFCPRCYNIYYLIIIVEGSNHELEVNPLVYQNYTDMIFCHKLLEESFNYIASSLPVIPLTYSLFRILTTHYYAPFK